jgi:hypothetical protein
VLDPALHCSSVITERSAPGVTTIALPEVTATVHVSAQKYNAAVPDTVIAHATYELLRQGPAPPGSVPAPTPDDAVVPDGMTYWAQGTSDALGILSFAVPAGGAWCLHELTAPPGYLPDPGFHCTAVLTTDTPAAAMTLALAEEAAPSPLELAFTGGPPLWLAVAGTGSVAAGAVVTVTTRRRRGRT